MTLLVPYDGSDLSRAALERAMEFGVMLNQEVVALSVVPTDSVEFALDRGWLDEDDPYDPEAICERLRAQVADVAPAAQFRCTHPEDVSEKATVEMDVARTVRQTAAELDADIVFVGSENAGRVSTPVSSVGSPVSEDPRYDVHIVRHAD
jgi:nucleotide-binding universal stress UspA family protein